MKGLRITLVRHGESATNARDMEYGQVPDHAIPLTANGRAQARAVGAQLGRAVLENALLYRSPYLRTRETLDEMLAGAALEPAAVKIYEDPRLREVEHGYEPLGEEGKKLRHFHGRFYFRYKGGESPADCFDRVSGFVDSLLRQAKRRRKQGKHEDPVHAIVVIHGLTIRCFVMRFFHMTVEQFDGLANPENADMIQIAPKTDFAQEDTLHFERGRWGVSGLRFRSKGAAPNGDDG